jgi:tryptophanase
VSALYNSTINKIKCNQQLIKLNDMPIAMQITKFAPNSYEVQYTTKFYGDTTHIHTCL